ncbi:MAG: class I SAM-dependent methyltransferase [Acidobacteria bacterium]|nr:MAG: class I SAM-dependent methyltransferase [Acidobacteriota bacterium]
MCPDRPQELVPQSTVRAVIYRGLLASAHALHKAGNACLAAAAGFLRRDELQAVSIGQHRLFALSPLEVDAGLSPGEARFYGKFLRDGERVLLVGCGSGRDLLALLSRGYQVTGLDPLAEVVELARAHLARRGMSAPVLAGFIQTAELGGPYDAVIFSNGCYCFLQGVDVRVATLIRTATHLAPHGRIIVSYYPAGRQSRFGRWLTRASARIGSADWVPEPGDTFSRDALQPALVRYHHAFEPQELARECESAGLRMLADEHCEEGCRFAAAAPVER